MSHTRVATSAAGPRALALLRSCVTRTAAATSASASTPMRRASPLGGRLLSASTSALTSTTTAAPGASALLDQMGQHSFATRTYTTLRVAGGDLARRQVRLPGAAVEARRGVRSWKSASSKDGGSATAQDVDTPAAEAAARDGDESVSDTEMSASSDGQSTRVFRVVSGDELRGTYGIDPDADVAGDVNDPGHGDGTAVGRDVQHRARPRSASDKPSLARPMWSVLSPQDARNPFATSVIDLRSQAQSVTSMTSDMDVANTYANSTGKVADLRALHVDDESQYPVVLDDATLPDVEWPRVYRQLHVPGMNDGLVSAFVEDPLAASADYNVSEIVEMLRGGSSGRSTGRKAHGGGSSSDNGMSAVSGGLKWGQHAGAHEGHAPIPVEALAQGDDGLFGEAGLLGPDLAYIGSSRSSKMEEKWNVGLYKRQWGHVGEILRERGVHPAWGLLFLQRSWTDQVRFAVEVSDVRLVDVPPEVLPIAPSGANSMLEVIVNKVYVHESEAGLGKAAVDPADPEAWKSALYTPRYLMQLADWVVKRVLFGDVVPVPLPRPSLIGDAHMDADAWADAVATETGRDACEYLSMLAFAIAGSQAEYGSWDNTLQSPLFKPFQERLAADAKLAWPVWSWMHGQPQSFDESQHESPPGPRSDASA